MGGRLQASGPRQDQKLLADVLTLVETDGHYLCEECCHRAPADDEAAE